MNVQRQPPWLAILLIVLAGSFCYANSFQVPFVLDDVYAIVRNTDIHSLEKFWSPPTRYVAYLTFALNYHFGGLEVFGYHLVNLLIHLGNAVLVYGLLRLTFRTPYFQKAAPGSSSQAPGALPHPSPLTPHLFISLFAALLFVAHPLQTQAVTYIVQRMTSLTALFYLLSVLLYVIARLWMERKAGRRPKAEYASRPESESVSFWFLLPLTGSVLAAVLAMMTKEIAFTLPLAMVLYELCFFRGAWKRRLFCLLPLLATLPIVPLSVLAVSRLAGVSDGLAPAESGQELFTAGELPRTVYLFTQFRVIVTYLRLLVMPVNQNLDYDYPVYTTFFTPPVLLSFLLLVAIFALALFLLWRTRCSIGSPDDAFVVATEFAPGVPSHGSRITDQEKNSSHLTPHSSRSVEALSPQPPTPELRLIAFGILWFFLTLAVESSLVPIKDVLAEHRLYLPSFGFLTACVAAGLLAAQKYIPTAALKVSMVVCVAVITALGYATWQRNQVWADEVRLWRDVIAKSPGKAMPYNDLGIALGARGEYAESIELLARSIELDPAHPYAYNSLAQALIRNNRSHEAVPLLKKAIGLHLRFEGSYINLAAAYNQLRRFDQTVAFLEPQMGWLGERVEAHYHLGVAYAFLGKREAALGKLAIVSERGAPHLADDLKRVLGLGGG